MSIGRRHRISAAAFVDRSATWRRGRRRNFESLETRLALAADPFISEFMAINDGTLADEDGAYSDWIEIHNPDAANVDLAGWYLTDNDAQLEKWQFPATVVPAGGYLVVFASDKDRSVTGGELHANFKLDGDGEYLALVMPDGQTVVSQFAPQYPRQLGDVSYGIGEDVRTNELIAASTTGRFRVPADGSLESVWPSNAFDDSAWTSVTTAVGFEGASTSSLPLPDNEHFYGPFGPGGTYNLYQLSTTPLGFSAAAAEAQSRTVGGVAGHMATIHSQGEADLVRDIRAAAGAELWIGLTDRETFAGAFEAGNTSSNPLPAAGNVPAAGERGRGFVWVTGEPFTFQRWLFVAPNDINGEDFVAVDAFGRWDDRSSSGDDANGSARRYLVEYELHLTAPPSVGDPSAAFRVTEVVGAGVLNTIGNAASAIDSGDGNTIEYTAATINHRDPQTNGTYHFAGPQPFGTDTPADDNDFALLAEGVVKIPAAGTYTFGVASDDGFRLRIKGATFGSVAGGNTVIYADTMEHAAPRGPADSLGVVQLEAGAYEIELLMYERGGGAMVELFAASGAKTAFDSSFRLVGDVAGGGLALSSYGHLIETDVAAAMHGVNASAYLRIPFDVEEHEEFDRLSLRMQYDDGFVAHLNGQEIARRNAPDVPAWDSSATADRPSADAMTFETIAVDGAVGELFEGENVLAIQLLNASAGDGDLLFAAELHAGTSLGIGERYFASPTPGGANDVSGIVGVVDDVEFSREHGFHDAAFSVTLNTDTSDAEIRYTTDGSRPTATTGAVYSGPITIGSTTTLRAAAFRPGYRPSLVETRTYVFLDDVIRQTGAHLPVAWGGVSADYEMDPNVVNDPSYSGAIVDDLLSLPTMSIVADADDLFGPSGIYVNPQGEGVAWERPASVELFYPDGREGFQVDAGLRMFGGASRNPGNTPKHSFRLLFKRDYGPTKLEFPLFGDGYDGLEAADRFDTVVLRANFNDSWGIGNANASHVVDEWSRRTQLDMGQRAGYGTFVHLYVNGLYWGLYNPVERHDASYMSTYFGGEDEDYDALHTFAVRDGNRTAWNTMIGIAAAGLASDAQYQAIQQYLDVENLIDYVIMNVYGGNWDWPHNNWDAARLREPGAGFQFYSWDAEGNLNDVNADRSDVNANDSPGFLYSQLRANAEFRLLFADRLHKHFFDDGALTTDNAAARFVSLTDEIDRAVVAESARWGDARREPPLNHDGNFVGRVNSLVSSYFPNRTNTVLNQFRGGGLYPVVDAPAFGENGGVISPGFELQVSLPTSQQYIDTTFLDSTAVARAIVPTNDLLGTSWRQPGFANFAGWTTGTLGVGYEQGSGYGPLIGTDVGAAMYNARSSVYVRKTFDLAAVEEFDRLLLRMKYDDGFVAYLNGVEIGRANAPATLAWNSQASTGNSDASAIVYQDFDVTAHKDLLVAGTNVLAIHGLNVGIGSSDMLILPEIVGQTLDLSDPTLPIWYTTDGSDPRLAGGDVSPSATQYGRPISLSASTVVKARTLDNGVWSAATEASFAIDLSDLRLTELMYHPAPHDGTDGLVDDDFEFVELTNVGGDVLDLGGVRFTNGIAFTFPVGTTLAPGQRVVIAANTSAFAQRYGAGVAVAGQYTGRLDNGGERLRLAGALGDELLDFRYDDDWRPITDGDGFSLTLVDPTVGQDALGNPSSWRASQFQHGSPGTLDVGIPDGAIVINEVLTNAATAADRRIELFNATAAAVDLSHWFVSDSQVELRKFQLPLGTTIPAGGYLVLSEQSHFGAVDGAAVPFGLSSVSGSVFLSSGDALGRIGGYRETVAFAGSAPNVPFGRILTSNGQRRFVAVESQTFGGPNAGPLVGPVVINEIMYHPADDGDAEFIEIRNVTSSTVPLHDPAAPEQTWQLLGGVTFDFPSGSSLAPQAYGLIVAGDPGAFRAIHGIPADVPIFGPYNGKLSNGGERIGLYRPGDPLPGPIVPVIEVDAIDFDDDPPWPLGADGLGQALGRIASAAFGDDVANWQLSTTGGTAGAANVAFDTTPPSAATVTGAQFIAASAAEIAWTSASDVESGVAFYQVFRDTILVATTTATTFTDAAVPSGTSFDYRVRAINGDGVKGAMSAPFVLGSIGINSAKSFVENKVVVTFSEPITVASATDPANYTVLNTIVLAADLAADARTVTLTVTSLLESEVYVLVPTNIVAASGRTIRPGAQKTFTLGEAGFVVRMVDVDGGADGQINSTTEAVNILSGNYAAGNYTFASDATITAPYVNFGGPASFSTPPNLTYPNGLRGSGSDPRREHFALSAAAVVTIPVGTWTIDFGSDDGGRVLLSGVAFASKYNDSGSAANEIRFEAARGHAHTGGTFTVSASPLVATLQLVMFEQGGGDSVDLSIAAGAKAGFDGDFQMLQHGTLGWSVKTQAAPVNQPPIVVDVAVAGSNWSPAFAAQFADGGYVLPDGNAQLAALPWTAVDRIRLRFSEAVVVEQSQLQIRGAAVANYSIAAFDYDATTKIATWTLASPIVADKVRLVLDDAVVDSGGVALDGDWIEALSTFSGNGFAGGDFSYRFNVLAGDVDGDGQSNVADVHAARKAQFALAGQSIYAARGDVNADGVANVVDLVLARDFGNRTLPVGEPSSSVAAAPAAGAILARRRYRAYAPVVDSLMVDERVDVDALVVQRRAERCIERRAPLPFETSESDRPLAARRPRVAIRSTVR